MLYETKNLFYVSNFNVIGGVESYIHELVRKYHDKDILVVYRTGDKNQIKRIKRYVPVVRYIDNTGMKFKTEKAFFNYETDIIDDIDAKEYIQLIHAMFKTQNIPFKVNPKITKWFAVSESAGKEWYELTGKKPKVVKNPLQITEEENKPVLWLISATRLTPEKGKDRMIAIGNELNKKGIKYIWLVFTNDTEAIDNPNIIYMKPRLDIRPYIASLKGRGYGVQVSNCEGDCYFTRECMALGVPTILTPVPSFKEQGYTEGKNCYYIPFDTSKDLKVERFTNIPEYKPSCKEDGWNTELVESKSHYKSDIDKKFKVRFTDGFMQLGIIDKLLNRIPIPGETIVVDYDRLEELLHNPFGIKLIDVISETKH